MQGRELLIAIGAAIVAVLLIGLLSGGMMMGPGLMGWGSYGPTSFGWWGIVMGVVMMLFWVLIIGGAIWLVATLFRQRPETFGPGGRKTALDILRERYARGEITREQFEQMRRDIEVD